MMEGLFSLHPSNQDLLASLTKGYAAYAFGIDETLYLEEKLAEKKSLQHKDQAIHNYSKSLSYGMRFFNEHDLDFKKLSIAAKDGSLAKLLDTKIDSHLSRNLDAVLFTAFSWAGLINLQKNDPLLIAQLYIPKSIFDWGCNKSPTFLDGFCPMFMGSYELSRPKMLGGRPENGKKVFLEAIYLKLPRLKTSMSVNFN